MKVTAARAIVPSERLPDDPQLLSRIAAGDLAALGALYDRYARAVWRTVARVLRDPSEAEDIVHSVFLNLPRMAGSYDGRPSCRAWLMGIAIRFTLRQRRGRGRFSRMLAGFRQTAADRWERDAEREVGTREDLALLQRALDGLTEGKRLAFLLVEVEGFSCVEAAEMLRIPCGTVRSRLFQVRREIAAAMERHGATPKSVARWAQPRPIRSSR